MIPGNGSPKSDVSTVGSKSTQRLAGSSGRVAGYGTSSRNMSIAGITRLMNAVPSRLPHEECPALPRRANATSPYTIFAIWELSGVGKVTSALALSALLRANGPPANHAGIRPMGVRRPNRGRNVSPPSLGVTPANGV